MASDASSVFPFSSSGSASSPPVAENFTAYKRKIDKILPYKEEYSHSNRVKGCLGSVFAITCLACVIFIFLNGHKIYTFQDFTNLFKNISVSQIGIGLGVTGVLVGGGLFVIWHVKSKYDPLLKTKHTSLPSEKDIVEVVYEYKSKKNDEPVRKVAYIDKSTLKNGSGRAYIYRIKPCDNHYIVATAITVASPFYGIAVTAYNAIRFFVVPFYILFCGSLELCRKDGLFEDPKDVDLPENFRERKFKPLDIPKEMWKSVKNVVCAPFYATALVIAALYSFINPGAGRTLASLIERDWNSGRHLPEGCWFSKWLWGQGAEKFWRGIEGGGGPNHLGFSVTYVGGCLQPVGVSKFENGKIIGKSIKAFILPGSGHKYEIYTREKIEELTSAS